MEKFTWDISEHRGTNKVEVAIETRKYIVSQDAAVLVHALMCINDTLEEITERIKK